MLRIFAELDFASDKFLSHVSTSIVLISWSLSARAAYSAQPTQQPLSLSFRIEFLQS
jgi:hypothetical protein